VQKSLLNQARQHRVLLTMVVSIFVVGFAAGILTTALTKAPASDAARVAARNGDLAPAAGLNADPWLTGSAPPIQSAALPSATEALEARPATAEAVSLPAPLEAPRAVESPRPAVAPLTATAAPQVLPQPAPSTAQSSATEAAQVASALTQPAEPTPSAPQGSATETEKAELPPTQAAEPAPSTAQGSATETARAEPAPTPVAEPAPSAAQSLATEATHAAAPTQVAALASPDHQLDGVSGAKASPEARLDQAALPEQPGSTEQIVVRRGDTLMDILSRAQIDYGEAYAAIESLRSIYDPRRLRAGQALTITAADDASDDPTRRLLGLSFDLNFDHQIRVTRSADGSYDATKADRPQHQETVRLAGSIDDSLYVAAQHAGLPQDVIAKLIKVFSWDVDFQRDLRPGDAFEATFEQARLEDGSDEVRGGDLLYGSLTLSGRQLEAYRFEMPDGAVEYYDRTGKSLRKFLLRTPVDGARISSPFGMRINPILGYSMMHRGVDFAAPIGTPIYAAGDGRIVEEGPKGGYGNYIRIRHNGEYSTAYAHMSRFAKGMSPGRRVHQGDVIGYIGTTGRSTGPHLHYEVLRDGSQINPMSVKQPPNIQLAGADLRRFQDDVTRIDRLRNRLAHDTLVASRVEGAGAN
jgi:murein DD-endopeptidase MepM/ murein hydrolase activator NlpD